MASPSKSPDLDVEAQLDVLKPHRASHHLSRHCPLGWNILTVFGKEPGEDDNHGTKNRPPEVASDASRAPADQAQPVASVSEAKGAVSIFSGLFISSANKY
jgi:hypothetical protein